MISPLLHVPPNQRTVITTGDQRFATVNESHHIAAVSAISRPLAQFSPLRRQLFELKIRETSIDDGQCSASETERNARQRKLLADFDGIRQCWHSRRFCRCRCSFIHSLVSSQIPFLYLRERNGIATGNVLRSRQTLRLAPNRSNDPADVFDCCH